MALVAYFIAAWMAPTKPVELYEQQPRGAEVLAGRAGQPDPLGRDVRSRFRELDRRLADVEAYVTSSNHRLAREIEELR